MDPSSGLHLVHVNSEMGFSGGESQMFMLMKGLEAQGHRVSLMCRRNSESAVRGAALGLWLRTVPMANGFDLRGVWSLWRELRQLQPDLVTLHTGHAAKLGGLASWLARVPAVTVRRMDREVKRTPWTRWVHQVWTQRTVGVSAAVVDCLLKGGVPRERLTMIQDAVDPVCLAPKRSPEEVRRAEGLPPNRPLLLTLARLDRRKGIDVLLQALAEARTGLNGPAPMLWVAGGGPEERNLQAQVSELDLTEDVRLLGQREDAADLLGACDVFVLPSRREGLGVAALEAMALGKPVVATRVGGLGQAVLEGETGELVPPDDPAALGQALVRVLGDAALRKRLSSGGPAHIATHFLSTQQTARYEALYREVLLEARP